MKILLTGATGLIGRALLERLLAEGHEVIAFCRNPPVADQRSGLIWCAGDFVRRLRPRHWRSELPGVEVVINTIGIFQESGLQTFGVMHEQAPAELWRACVDYGVKRVIQLSALGAAEDAPTEYWRSKARGDQQLLAIPGLEACVVRPALVFAEDGVSSRLFCSMAAWPVLLVPRAAATVQPIHRDDLVELLLQLATQETPLTEPVVHAVGPRALGWSDYLQALRGGMGLAKARVLRVPTLLVQVGCLFAALSPGNLLSGASFRMLRQGSVGRAGDAEYMARQLGHPLRDPASFTKPAHKTAAIHAGTLPLLRWSLAFVWLLTALVSALNAPEGLRLLAAIGLPPVLQSPALLGGVAIDALFGALTLWRPSRRLWQAQFALVLGYTVIISVLLPEWWLHPFGPISKNLPILALLVLCARLDQK